MTTFRVDFVRGKDRPRFTGTGRTYTTKRTRDDEQAIRAAYLDVIAKEGNVLPAEHQTGREPFILLVDAYRALPKSRPKKVLCEEDTFKPDWDNIGKLVSDALNGLAWKDDSQVVKADISKWPRMRGLENDRMVITVIPLGLMNMDEVAEVNPCRS